MNKPNWINIDDKLPEHGQHVLVWDDSDNIHSSPGVGDDGNGRIKIGDAVYFSGQVEWDERKLEDRMRWGNDTEEYKSINAWDTWSGQGPCSFDQVTHWQPLPQPPTK